MNQSYKLMLALQQGIRQVHQGKISEEVGRVGDADKMRGGQEGERPREHGRALNRGAERGGGKENSSVPYMCFCVLQVL